MPPISPQGSRTGLITALVIFVILFVTSTILFIYVAVVAFVFVRLLGADIVGRGVAAKGR